MRYLIGLFLGILILTGCDRVSSAGDAYPLQTNLELNSTMIERISDLKADYTVINVADTTVRYSFSSSCQHVFLVTQGAELIIDSRGLYGCPNAISHLELDPMESETYPISVDMADDDFELESGEYELTVFLIDVEDTEVSASFEIE